MAELIQKKSVQHIPKVLTLHNIGEKGNNTLNSGEEIRGRKERGEEGREREKRRKKERKKLHGTVRNGHIRLY